MSIPKFLQYLQYEKNYSPKTIESYGADLEEFQKFYLSESAEEDISNSQKIHLRSYLMSLSKSSFSERSINRKISSLKSYYKYLLKIGEMKASPAAGIKTIKHYNEPQIPFSEDELKNLFEKKELFPDNFEGFRDRLILELFYQTGMRRSELIGLKITDMDFHEKNIKVTGKRNKQRIIPLNDNLLKQLKQYIELRQNQYGNEDPHLFLTQKGKPFYDKLVYNLVNSYLSHVSTKKKKSPHILRHSFATHMLNHGAELNAVKELLGHSNLSATQVYTHGSIEQLKKVFNQAHPREQKNQAIMTINLQTVNFNAKNGLEEYVERKLSKLEQYYDKIIAVQVNLRVENIPEKENKFVDIKLEVPGDDIVVKKSGQSFEECIDLSVDTLKKLIIRKKEKITDR